jgi:coatomer subunit epsilon
VSAYLKINRSDLAEQTLRVMKSVDEDAVLTTLASCWIHIHSSTTSQSTPTDSLIASLNEMGEKYGYTLKTYNLLAIALMLNQDYERAMKVFDSALTQLNLDTPEGDATHLYAGN